MKIDFMNYKKEDLLLKDIEQTERHGQSNPNTRGGNYYFNIEDEYTIEEKIKICDSLLDNYATNLIDLLLKLQEDIGSKIKVVKKSHGEEINTSSFKAWLKKHDITKVAYFSDDWLHGKCLKIPYIDVEFRLWEILRCDDILICPNTSYGYQRVWTDKHIVNQVFHKMIIGLRNEEISYFKTIDEYEIKYAELKEIAGRNTPFDCERLNMVVWNGRNQLEKQNATLEDLTRWIEAYKNLAVYADELSRDL